MNSLLVAFERASLFGLAALVVAFVAQRVLDGRVPASWRVWVWRVALLQTALSLVLALVPLAPLRLAVLPPQTHVNAVASPPSVVSGSPQLVLAHIEPSQAAPRTGSIPQPLTVPISATQAARPSWLCRH